MLARLLRRRVDPRPAALGDRARDRRDWPSAARHYRAALDSAPEDAAIWVQYGHALKESGDVAAAEAAYREAIDRDPAVADTHLQLGHALKLQGREPAAVASYLQALSLDPRLYHAALELVSLGWSMERVNDWIMASVARQLRRGSTGPATEAAPGAAERQAIVFDVGDLFDYFREQRVPTGVQRVQMNVIGALLRGPRREFETVVAAFSPSCDFWVRVPDGSFLELVELATAGGALDDPDWLAALADAELAVAGGAPLSFPRGAALVNLGTSWWLPDYFLSLRAAKARFGVRFVQFVHDCIPAVAQEHCTPELSEKFIGWIAGVCRHADGFLVNSEATAADLKRVARQLGHAIALPHVIRLDAAAAPQPETAGHRRPVEGLIQRRLGAADFVLFVSTIESRKNHMLAFDVWLDLLRRRGAQKTPMLVCLGNPGWMHEAVMARLEASPQLQQKVIVAARISDAELADLYRRCLFTLYPSSFEGWGLPVTESLAWGKVPVTTRLSSLPEAGGDLAEYFDVRSQRDLYDTVVRLIDDPAYRASREAAIRQGFRARRWSEIADQIVTCVEKLPASPEADIRPLPIEVGRYYAVARNRERRLFPGVGDGDTVRTGAGWWPPEDWGTWLKHDRAEIAFSVPDAADGPHVLYLGLCAAAGSEAEYEAGLRGAAAAPETGRLAPGERRWLALAVEPAALPDRSVRVDLATRGSGAGPDDARLGVVGLYLCEAADLPARLAFLEALQLDRLDRLGAPRPSPGEV